MPNNKQLKAEVLEHWNRMLELSVDDIRAGKESPDGENCAFCKHYYDRSHCTDCPICKKTGFPICLDTPWSEVNRAYNHIAFKQHRRLSEFRKAVKAEIDFLEKLEV